MRYLICGGRDFSDKELLYKKIDMILPEDFKQISPDPEVCLVPDVTIVHGAAKGADSLAGEYAKTRNYDVEEYPADWDKHGKIAGFVRNQEMVDSNPDIVIAFWDGVSKGTKDTINKAKKKKITTLIVYY